MKNLLNWSKTHLWQSILIGIAALGVVATSITLPIVLGNKEAPQEETKKRRGKSRSWAST